MNTKKYQYINKVVVAVVVVVFSFHVFKFNGFN